MEALGYGKASMRMAAIASFFSDATSMPPHLPKYNGESRYFSL
jgi:hypothetical protein